MAISNQELQKIRHLDVENINGRVIATLMFYIEDSWEWWVETEIGLMKLQGWPAESGYFGNKAEKQTDMSFLFLDFLVQRASIPSISTYITGITDDIFNLSASLKKVAFLHHKRDEIGYGLSRMIIGEIEYLISTCRAIYDLLQELIAKVWHTIKLHDETAPKKKQLVDRFFKMVAKGTPAIPLSVNEIAETYKIPAQLAEFYVRQSSYFLALRDFRDRIIHSGKSVDTVFVADDDFLVREAFVPLKVLGEYLDSDRRDNGLVALTPTLNSIVCRTILSLNDFAETIQSFVEFPPPLAPGMQYYLRGYFDEHFSNAIAEFEGRMKR